MSTRLDESISGSSAGLAVRSLSTESKYEQEQEYEQE